MKWIISRWMNQQSVSALQRWMKARKGNVVRACIEDLAGVNSSKFWGTEGHFRQLQQPLFTLVGPHRAFLQKTTCASVHFYCKRQIRLLSSPQHVEPSGSLPSDLPVQTPQACEPSLTFSLWRTTTVPLLTLIVSDSSEILIYHSKLEIYIFLSLRFVPAIY